MTWELKPHTSAKHEILRRYLSAWYPILTVHGRNPRVTYIDGFAGPGAYSGGELGSPLIALDTLVNHGLFKKLSRVNFNFVFVEKDPVNFASLERNIEGYWRRIGSKPKNIGVFTYNSKFADVARTVIEAKGSVAYPTFAFIDPFGWSDIPMRIIGDLLSTPKCDVMISFMYDSLNRFVGMTEPDIVDQFKKLFGITDDEHLQVANLSGDGRERFLVDLYANQLRRTCGFQYVRNFGLFDSSRGRVVNHLMFGTRSIEGLKVFKGAIWKLDPASGLGFRGRATDQMVLFEPKPDFRPLREALLDQFAGQTVSIGKIEQFVLAGTDYGASHTRSALRPMENEKLIICVSERKLRNTYPKGTVLRFASRSNSHQTQELG